MDRGICHLSQIPLRAEPKSAAEMVSQLLYGETYAVLEFVNEWYRIKMDFDGYEGWISQTSYCGYQEQNAQIQTQLYLGHWNNVIPNIPIITSMGSHIVSSKKQSNLHLLELVRAFIGVPYLWGGRHFSGIDCSGFVQVVYKCLGVALPRDASQQQKVGKALPFANLHEGDLVFFEKNEKIGHVGIALLDGKIIHAHGRVRIDQLTPKGIINSETGIQTHNFHSAKRIR